MLGDERQPVAAAVDILAADRFAEVVEPEVASRSSSPPTVTPVQGIASSASSTPSFSVFPALTYSV